MCVCMSTHWWCHKLCTVRIRNVNVRNNLNRTSLIHNPSCIFNYKLLRNTNLCIYWLDLSLVHTSNGSTQGSKLTFWCTGPLSSAFRFSLDKMQFLLARCWSNSNNYLKYKIKGKVTVEQLAFPLWVNPWTLVVSELCNDQWVHELVTSWEISWDRGISIFKFVHPPVTKEDGSFDRLPYSQHLKQNIFPLL